MKLLFITQKLHGQDSFTVLWVKGMMQQGFDVTVLCLEGSDERYDFPVLSMGKEKGLSKFQLVWNFRKLIRSEEYDRVFVHMAPVYYALGFWYWKTKKTPTYLWYTHYKMQLGVKLFGWFGTRFFCATSQSLPQYPSTGSGQAKIKKTVVGHGIDLSFWSKRMNTCQDPRNLLVVHRLSRSKRLELILHAMKCLDSNYSLDIYGVEAEADYVAEMKQLTKELQLEDRVKFHGTIPMTQLPNIYADSTVILNMASETIDKTMLEAMTCGCFPITTPRNAKAIGLTEAVAKHREQDLFAAPESLEPQAIADYIEEHSSEAPLTADEMYAIVEKKHSLTGLMRKMAEYIREGE